MNRREALKVSGKVGAFFSLSQKALLKLGVLSTGLAVAHEGVLVAKDLIKGGKDYSPGTKKERQAIPTACWSCTTRDSMIGYIEDGRLVKIEGQPLSMRGQGKICAKAHAGINQVYDPDRILYPMVRTGKRGENKWKRISWDEALKMIVNGYTRNGKHIKGLKEIRKDNPGKFMFHYGRMKSSSSKMIKDIFLTSYGTKTIGNHTSICEGGKWTAQELTWGKHYDNWDIDNTRFILNFGSNVLEAHTNHIPLAQRIVDAMVERNVRMITFDVRLSTTAARSSEWAPVKPGTDGAVVLAMCHTIVKESIEKEKFGYKSLIDKDFLKFCKITDKHNATLEEKMEALIKYLNIHGKPGELNTPEWAEKISGVSASKIRSIALEFAKSYPAVVISYRGAVAHYNGNDTERAIQMLAAITGNIDNPGGRCRGVGASWKYPKPKKFPKAKALKILDGFKGQIALPTHHANHQIFKMIKDGKMGRPDIYMWYCYNPVYVNGDCKENIDILKDENLIPFTIAVDPFYSESGALADLILPDATYLERWDYEDNTSPNQIAEYHIRQPLIKPLGEARDFCDVTCDIAKMLGIKLGYKNKVDFVKKSCYKTKIVKDAAKKVGEDPFEYMKKRGGVWYNDPNAKLIRPKPKFFGYKKIVDPLLLKKEGVILDAETGVYWNWKKVKVKSLDEATKSGYTNTKNAYKGYVAQKIGDKVYEGFKPDKLNKSGYFELYSNLLVKKKYPGFPTYTDIPDHKSMKPDQLILTTYKVNVHIHSRSTNCKWLTEIYHENPALINPITASKKGIQNGDLVKIKSKIGEITSKVRLSEGVVPGVIAISMHLGRWQYGRYASANRYAMDNTGKSPLEKQNLDNDVDRIWWRKKSRDNDPTKWSDGVGIHPNWIIANNPNPVNGQQTWMDTVVDVTKV